MSVDYKKIGEAIGESQRKSVEESKRLIQELHYSFAELNKDLVGALKEDSQKLYAEHALQIEELCKQIQEQEVLKAQLDQRIAEIKDGEDGKDGEKGDQGEQGNDGLDRPLLEPVELKADKDYSKGVLGTHNGGLWISKKEAVGNPDDDRHAWHCILDAMTTMSIDLQEDHTFKLSVRTSAGNLIEDEFHIPYPEHKGVWEEGSYTTGQIVTKGSSMWQAMEDTEKAPPGNGWKQILSAPRGKQGPAGKSIAGPTGKPGRNGLDAKLPEGFVDELIALANMNKAFEDGRSDAYSITSFRGYFMPDESYSAGDVVNDLSGLYVCTQAGAYKNVGTGFELMMGMPKQVKVAYMHWQGNWQQKTYDGGMTVRDGDWAMVATTRTSDRAAPQPIGQAEWVSQEGVTPTWESTQSTAATQLVYGQEYNISTTGYLTGARIWIDEAEPDVEYGLFIRINHDGYQNTSTLMTPRAFTATGWHDVSVVSTIVRSGSTLDLYAVKSDVTSSTDATFNYNYQTPQNTIIPPAGAAVQARGDASFIRFASVDADGTDRASDLALLIPGDRISTAGIDWVIVDSTDGGSYYEFDITPPSTGTAQDDLPFVFTTYSQFPIDYVDIPDHFTSNPNVIGFYSDHGISNIASDENMYGVDLQVQAMSISDDWDVISPPPSVSGQSEALLTARETAWVAAASTDLELGVVSTTTNGWAEIGRFYVMAGNGYDVEFKVTGKRTDAIGFSAGRYGMLVYRNGGVSADYETMYEYMSAGLNVRARAEGDHVVIEVDGRSGQDWDWRLLGFSQEIT